MGEGHYSYSAGSRKIFKRIVINPKRNNTRSITRKSMLLWKKKGGEGVFWKVTSQGDLIINS